MKNVSSIILAGGKSERMNFPKPFLLFDRKKTFLEKIIGEYKAFGCKKILVVVNSELFSDKWEKYFAGLLSDRAYRSNRLKFIPNAHVDSGRFYSIKLGVSELKNDGFCFLQNTDNPFVTVELLNELFRNKNEKGYAVPYYKDKGGHPVLLSPSVINYVKEERRSNLNLKEVLANFPKRKISVSDDKILVNINTEEDWGVEVGLVIGDWGLGIV